MITSSSNQQIKDIKRLKDRKYRDETHLFFIEGIRLVHDAMRKPKNIKTLVFSRELSRSQKTEDIVRTALKAGIPVLEVGTEVLRPFPKRMVRRDWLQ